MEIFTKKKKLVEAIEQYADEAGKTIEFFMQVMRAFFEKKSPDELKELVKKVRKHESKCDQYRREIEHHLFAGALMPGSRGDIFMLLEAVDKVPNKAEQVANFVLLAAPSVPDEFHEPLNEVLTLTQKCTNTLMSAMKRLFSNLKKATNEANEVEQIETDVDKLERKLTWQIFHAENIDMGHKMLLHQLVTGVCSLSDRAEDASDKIEIMAVKRKT